MSPLCSRSAKFGFDYIQNHLNGQKEKQIDHLVNCKFHLINRPLQTRRLLYKHRDNWLINRPGVAGAVLQSPPSFIKSVTHSLMVCGNIFKVLSIPSHKSWGAEILRECSPSTMCHMSHVKCHLSGVTCQVSCVRCHVSGVRCQVSGVRCQVSGFTCHMSPVICH